MQANYVPKRLITLLILAIAVVAASAIGAWEAVIPSPTAAVEQHSAFVQSGGVMNDADPSVPDAARVLSHARAPSEPEVAATTF